MQFEIIAQELNCVGYLVSKETAASAALEALVVDLPHCPPKCGPGTFAGENVHCLAKKANLEASIVVFHGCLHSTLLGIVVAGDGRTVEVNSDSKIQRGASSQRRQPLRFGLVAASIESQLFFQIYVAAPLNSRPLSVP